MQKLSQYLEFSDNRILSTITSSKTDLIEANKLNLFTSLQEHNNQSADIKNHEGRPPFHLHENSLINHKHAAETAIQIIAAKQPMTDLMLCRYLKERKIIEKKAKEALVTIS